jgi:hypothetical protein
MEDIAATEPTEPQNSPTDLLAIVRAEMERAVGFDNDAELRDDRERALLYYKGDVSKDIQTIPNRSKAVSSDLSDAVETILPDLMEIFIGGDDVVAFKPQKQQDIEPSKQETAFLTEVVLQRNPGFLNFYTAFKDALLLKTGIFHWEWEEDVNEETEDFTGKNAVELQLAAADGDVSNVKADGDGQTYSFTVTKRTDNSMAKYWAIAPEDFAAAPDTIDIAHTTYCVERQRPRVQDLIALGFDAAKVRELETYSPGSDETIRLARDNAGESNETGEAGDDTDNDLRQVEVRKHCIRILGKNNKLELVCLYSDAQASNELYKEKIERIPYAVGSPYLIPHRLIGRSLADMLVEVQKIKTALYRMCLDCGFFALNQRSEVALERANEFTITDLLKNEPLQPVRSRTGDAVRPLVAGPLNFDPYKAIEFFSTVAEGRTGVVRNAQGLNPDTLHDTAKGALMLLSAAQKRTKMIARIMAETLVKPLYLGMHACIRENAKSGTIANLLGKWVPVDPTKWAERNAMTVEVGLGAGGKDVELAAMNQIVGDMALIVKEQGGAAGPIVTQKNVYRAAIDKARKLGVKTPEEYYTDPANAPPQPPRPDPEMIKVQGEQQLAAMKQQGEMQLAQAKMASEESIQQHKAQTQAAVNQQQQQLEHARLVAQQQGEMAMEQLKIASQERIAVEVARINAEANIASAGLMAKNRQGDEGSEESFQRSHETSTA